MSAKDFYHSNKHEIYIHFEVGFLSMCLFLHKMKHIKQGLVAIILWDTHTQPSDELKSCN